MTFKNRPAKLIATSVLNMVGKQSSKFANAGAAFAVLFYFIKQFGNYTFDEELQGVSEYYRNILFGGVTGFVYKAHRGFSSAIFAALLASLGTAGVFYFRNKNKKVKSNSPRH